MFEHAEDAEMFRRSIATAAAPPTLRDEPPERPEAVRQAAERVVHRLVDQQRPLRGGDRRQSRFGRREDREHHLPVAV
jgi:hypothetical protein